MTVSTQSAARPVALALALEVALALFAAAPAHAADEGRNSFQFSVFAAQQDTQIRSAGFFGNAGTPVRAESDLGLPRQRAAGAFGYQRLIGQNWHFAADYLHTQREATQVLARPLSAQGVAYPAGATVQSRLRLQVLGLAGGLALTRSEGARFGVELGGYVLDARLSIRPPTQARYEDTAAELMPLLGLFGHTTLGTDWRIEGRLRQGQASGSKITEATLQAVWRGGELWQLGAGWRGARGRIKDDQHDFFSFSDTRIDFDLRGPQLFARLVF